jgi:threonine/homoserine/homoserine lactone efflux protein
VDTVEVPAHVAAFLAVSALVIVVPGPDMALVARNALRGGRRGGIATGIGVVSGLATWSLAASLGLAALLRASEPAFVALRLAGGAYLVYLGGRSVWAALRRAGPDHPQRLNPHDGTAPLVSLRQGFLSNLGNPKIAVFFTSFLPQFVPDHRAPFLALLTLGLLFCSLTLVWLTGYSILVARAGDFLRRSSIRRALDGLTGAVLIGLGLRLAAARS